MTLAKTQRLDSSIRAAQSRLAAAQDALLAIKHEHDWRLELERQAHLRKEQVLADEFAPRMAEAAALVKEAERVLIETEIFAGKRLERDR